MINQETRRGRDKDKVTFAKVEPPKTPQNEDWNKSENNWNKFFSKWNLFSPVKYQQKQSSEEAHCIRFLILE